MADGAHRERLDGLDALRRLVAADHDALGRRLVEHGHPFARKFGVGEHNPRRGRLVDCRQHLYAAESEGESESER